MYNTSIQISFNRKNGCFFYIFTRSITNQILSIMCTCDNSLYLWHLDKKNCETLTGKIGKKNIIHGFHLSVKTFNVTMHWVYTNY